MARRLGIWQPANAQRVEDLARLSSEIIVGVVESSSSRWDPGSRMIVTDTAILVTQRLKGRAQERVVVTTPGGILPENNLGMVVTHTPRFADGEGVLVFLGRDQYGRVSVVAGEEGKLSIRNDLRTGRRLAGSLPLDQVVERIRRAASRP